MSTASESDEKVNLPGYPMYPAGEDIYSRSKEEMDVNPEDITKLKVANELQDVNNEKGFSNDVSGGDLDVPGSELDDVQENVGSEDEENNLYSLGGDNHDEV